MQIPENAIEFNERFNSEESCLAFLKEIRWPNGFICPNCQHDDGYQLKTRPLIQCVLCKHQTSITSGTIFHRTHLPLRIWFYIIFSMAQDKGGASSCRLAAELGIQQKTAWHIMHKLRHAMSRRDEGISLAGFVEMDEAVLGPEARRPTVSRKAAEKTAEGEGVQKPPKVPIRSRGRKKAGGGGKRKIQTDVLVLVEQEPHHAGFVAMKVLNSTAADDLLEFLECRIDICQHIKSDGWQAHHTALRKFLCTYEAVVCSGPEGCTVLPVVHRTISLLKTFLMGTYYGVAQKYLQQYLHEFSFRFNRRDTSHPIWFGLVRACVFGLPFTIAELIT